MLILVQNDLAGLLRHMPLFYFCMYFILLFCLILFNYYYYYYVSFVILDFD